MNQRRTVVQQAEDFAGAKAKLAAMPDKIVFVAVDHGIDGRGDPKVMYAAWNVDDMASLFAQDKSCQYRQLETVTINVAQRKAQALAKLDGLDRLLLGIKA